MSTAVAVREHPILFSGSMVRAILASQKTQTRRVVDFSRFRPSTWTQDSVGAMRLRDGGWQARAGAYNVWSAKQPCPYGQPGDRLWVRETFRQSDGSMSVHYRADPDEVSGGPWRPSIFMPRWASRLTLEITAVRVQRLQEISEQDAIAEGIERLPPAAPPLDAIPRYRVYGKDGEDLACPYGARISFSTLWDSINGKRAPWESNPWVWALTFRRVQP